MLLVYEWVKTTKTFNKTKKKTLLKIYTFFNKTTPTWKKKADKLLEILKWNI